MPRRVMAFVVVASLALVTVWVAPRLSSGAPTGALSAPIAFVAVGSPIAGTPEATPDLGADLPAEIALTLLAHAEVDGLPVGRAMTRLERTTIPVSSSLTVGGDGMHLLVIESGSVSLSGSLSGQFDRGAQMVLPPGTEIEISATSFAGVSLLHLTIGGTSSMADATPVAETSSDVLFASELSRLPGRRGTVTMVRASIPPGVETGSRQFDGPVALIVEAGTVAFTGAEDGPVEVIAGTWVVAPPLASASLANPGSDPATVLLIGIFPIASTAATTSSPTPTTGPDLAATAQADADDARATADVNATAAAGIAATADALATEASGLAATANAYATEVAGLEATVAAQATAIAEAEGERASTNAQATASGSNAATAQALSEADATEAAATIAALQTAQAGTLNELATAEAARATAQGALALLATAEASLSRTFVAQATAMTDGATALSAAQTAEAAANATITALSTTAAAEIAAAGADVDNARATASAAAASAEATLAAVRESVLVLQTVEADLRATVAAQADHLSEAATAQATSEASSIQSRAAADALATMLADTKSELATAEASAATMAANATANAATAQATISALETASANTAADAQATIEAMGTAGAEAAAAAQATIEAQTTSAAATVAALEGDAANQSATAAAQESAARATAQALLGGQEALVATISAQSTASANQALTAAADATSAAATVAALATQVAESADRVTSAINPEFVELSIQVDLGGVLGGSSSAIEAAQNELDSVLQPYLDANCQAGVVLTFGHSGSIGEGTQLAAAVNALIQNEYPAIFGGAAFDNFGDLRAPLGQVDIRVYFFTGCDPAGA